MSDKVAKLERLVGDMLQAQHKQERVNVVLLDALKAVDRRLPDADMCFDPDNSLRDIVRAAIDKAEG
jgi:hypothetical protein